MVWKHIHAEELTHAHKEAKLAWHFAIGEEVFVDKSLSGVILYSSHVSIRIGLDWDWCDTTEAESLERIWQVEALRQSLKERHLVLSTRMLMCSVSSSVLLFHQFPLSSLYTAEGVDAGPLENTSFSVKENNGRTFKSTP